MLCRHFNHNHLFNLNSCLMQFAYFVHATAGLTTSIMLCPEAVCFARKHVIFFVAFLLLRDFSAD